MGTIVTRETEFDDAERALLLAHLELEADIGPYGIPLSEAMADSAQVEWTAVPRTNWVEKTVADARDAFYKANPDVSRNGHVWLPRRIKKKQ